MTYTYHLCRRHRRITSWEISQFHIFHFRLIYDTWLLAQISTGAGVVRCYQRVMKLDDKSKIHLQKTWLFYEPIFSQIMQYAVWFFFFYLSFFLQYVKSEFRNSLKLHIHCHFTWKLPFYLTYCDNNKKKSGTATKFLFMIKYSAYYMCGLY